MDRLNPNMPHEEFERQLQELGYYDSLPKKYFKWVKNIVKLDFGYSIKKNQPIGPIMATRVKNTIALMGSAYVLSILIGIPLGVRLSCMKNKRLRKILHRFNNGILAVPSFLIGMLLIKWFSFDLGWLPAGGMYSMDIADDASRLIILLDRLNHMILPLTVILVLQLPVLIKFVDSQMTQIYAKPFKTVLTAKGLSERKIVWIHCFKNILVPLTGLISTQFPMILSGALVTEGIFNYPGMGALAFESAMSRDFPMVMALLIVNGIMVIAVNFVAEGLYPLLDPRINTGESDA